MNFSNRENGEKLAFPQNYVTYSKELVPGLNRFYSGHFQNTPNSKTFFGCALSYPCPSILLATFNYRARGTCAPCTLNYSLNGAANA